MNKRLGKQNLVYPALSYRIVGVLFDVYNALGDGHKEKYYQPAVAIAFRKARIKFKEQIYIPIKFDEKRIGHYYLDFLIEDKIVLELKQGDNFGKRNIQQVYSYLKSTGLKLRIIANFTSAGLKSKRIVNLIS